MPPTVEEKLLSKAVTLYLPACSANLTGVTVVRNGNGGSKGYGFLTLAVAGSDPDTRNTVLDHLNGRVAIDNRSLVFKDAQGGQREQQMHRLALQKIVKPAPSEDSDGVVWLGYPRVDSIPKLSAFVARPGPLRQGNDRDPHRCDRPAPVSGIAVDRNYQGRGYPGEGDRRNLSGIHEELARRLD